MPVVYNRKKSEGRSTAETQFLSKKEYNNALDVGFTAMNNRFIIKTEKFCEEISDLRQRIIHYNLHGEEGLDDSDIDFLQDEIDDDSDSDIEFEALIPQPVVSIKLENDDEIDNSENVAKNDETISNSQMVGNVSLNQSQPHPLNHDESQLVSNGSTSANNEKQAPIDDVLFGRLTCVKNDLNDHYYPDFETSIRAPIANVLYAWNSTHPFNSLLYDKKFVGVLLKQICGTRCTDDDLNDKQLGFIKHLLKIRVKGDVSRLNRFDAIVAEKYQKAKGKTNANN